MFETLAEQEKHMTIHFKKQKEGKTKKSKKLREGVVCKAKKTISSTQ